MCLSPWALEALEKWGGLNREVSHTKCQFSKKTGIRRCMSGSNLY